jgi:hypothetical protein
MKLLRILFVAGLVSTAARAADREFTEVVRAISDEFGTHPMRIPLFGLVNAFVYVARPAGAKHVDVAIFENLGDRGRGRGDVAATIRSAVGTTWRPFVQVRSNRNERGETVLVYMREQKDICNLLVTSIERDEAVVVQIKLNPEGLRRWMVSPQDSALHWNESRHHGWSDESREP